MTWEIRVPLPLRYVSPNFHGHWRYRARATKETREIARIAAMGDAVGLIRSQKENPGPIRISVVMNMARRGNDSYYRPLDAANAIGSLKATMDGLVDAGVVPSDSHEWVIWGDVVLNRTAKAHGGKCGVVLTVEAIAI